MSWREEEEEEGSADGVGGETRGQDGAWRAHASPPSGETK